MSSFPSKILAACSAAHIPPGHSGLWDVLKCTIRKEIDVPRNGKVVTLTPGTYTKLVRHTAATVHLGFGEVVMEDTIFELRTHLNFMLRARGRVLVTGLGLGCVVRGLLANPAVEHVTVIERDADVLKLIMPHAFDVRQLGRVSIIQAEALHYVTSKTATAKFDCAWHDVWTDESAGEEHLHLKHMKLLCETQNVAFQGAWSFPREYRRGLANVI
ncbi:MAG: hypothetical protein V4587_00275 [Acidobacteriota bacterium]